MRVLLAEDAPALAESLLRVLRHEGFVVDHADRGDRADYWLRTERYDAVVLDLGLPVQDGLSLLRGWREDALRVPVLILTARGRWPEKAAGFAAGADDYVTKPFEPMEVVARLHALIRRAHGQTQSQLMLGPVTIDAARAEVLEGGQPVVLTAQEFKLLHHLALSANRVVTRTALRDHLYPRDSDPDSNVIDVLVSRMRRKFRHPLIETVRGQGFMVRDGAP